MPNRNLVKVQKPLIFIVDNSRAVTGALNAMRHATRPLQEHFDFQYVLPTGSTGRAVLEKDGFRVHELPFVEISRRKGDLLQYVPMLLINGWRLRKLTKHHGSGVIHLNDFYNLTGYIANIMSFGQLKVVTHVRFLPQSLPQPLARCWRWLGENLADNVVCVSEAVRRYFSTSENVQVIYDPIPGPEQHTFQPPAGDRLDGTVQVLYLSNYIQGKGQDFAVEAFRQAYQQDTRLRLTFVGGDMGMAKNQAFREQLETTVQTYSLAEVVTFKGFVTDVEQAIKEADILLNFSESESFSLTCLDALYYGTPLIASDCGGPAELFENGVSGLLVPNRDVAAMTSALVRLAGDAQLRRQFSEQGRAYVRRKFSAAATYENLGQLYTRLTSQ